jgi:hypothetical protein
VASELQANSIKSISESDIVEGVLEWKLRRRPPLEPAEVAYTVRNLAGLKWLDVVPDADEILAYDMAEGT